MPRNSIIAGLVAAFALVVVLANSLYVVGQTQQAVILNLGSPVRVVNKPGANEAGLKLKIPFVETVVRFDKLNLKAEQAKQEITTANQEKMDVDAFLVYRITDPLQFYKSAQTAEGGDALLRRVINSALREALGSAPTEDIISSKRAQLMLQVRNDVARRVAQSHFGVQVIDLRIKRADLPAQNEEAVFIRMQSQRQQEAQQIRADGEARAQAVRGAASKEAETTRGEADAERARIFAAAYGKDASFAAFYRSMRAYEDALATPDRTLVLSPDSEFFRYMRQGPGGK